MLARIDVRLAFALAAVSCGGSTYKPGDPFDPGDPGTPRTCDAGCPAGYRCSDGVCTGGDPTALVFDPQTVLVSGALTVDGAPPVADPSRCSGDQVRLQFLSGPPRRSFFDPEMGSVFSAFVPCAARNGAFTARIGVGTHRVTAYQYDSDSSFPDATFVVDPALAVSGATTGLTWDLPTFSISGNLTVDGRAPVADRTRCSGDQVRIQFVNEAGAAFSAFIPCASTTGAFSARIAPGTYRVTAYQYDSDSSFPDATFVVDPALHVSGAVAGLRWDLSTVPVSGNLTVDGRAPVADRALCSGDQVRIQFVNEAGAAFSAFIPCGSTTGAFSTRIAPGTYRVTAYQYDSDSSFPDATFVVDPALQASTAATGLKWDLPTFVVSGNLTVDGRAPVADRARCSGDQVRIQLVNPQGAAFSAFISCASTTGAFTARVAPGTYRVTAYQYDSDSSFPDATFVVDPALQLTAATSGLRWDLQTLTVSGRLRGRPTRPARPSTSSTAISTSSTAPPRRRWSWESRSGARAGHRMPRAGVGGLGVGVALLCVAACAGTPRGGRGSAVVKQDDDRDRRSPAAAVPLANPGARWTAVLPEENPGAAALPEVRSAADLQRHDGERVRLLGVYHEVDVRQMPDPPPVHAGHVSLRLEDGSHVAVYPIWRREARRSLEEIGRLRDRRVVAVGRIQRRAPADPSGGASPIDPCIDELEALGPAGQSFGSAR